MKRFDKGMDKSGEGFKRLQTRFSGLNDAKFLRLIGSLIRNVLANVL